MEYTLTIESTPDNQIKLFGDITRVTKNRFALSFMKDYTSYELGEGYILINISDGLEKTIERVKVIAEYAGCELHFGSEISTAFAEYQLEEEKFQVFSDLALAIRNNECVIEEFEEFKNSLDNNLPARTLYPLQLLSAYHLAFSQNGCNFSVPGAGKTSVVYGAYAYLKNLPEDHIKHVDKLIIIGPLSSFGPWEMEYKECFGTNVNAKRLVGNMPLEDKKQYLYSSDTAELTLLSYASVVSIREELQYFLSKHKTMIVLDEAHKIKNTRGGITAQSVMQLSKSSKARIVLTGTPAPNGYEDLVNLFKFIWPTKDIIRFNVGQLRDMTRANGDPRVVSLLEAIMPYFIRVRKSDLGLTPPTEHPPIIIQMKDAQKRVYDYIERRYTQDLSNALDKKFINAVSNNAKVIRLMQAATNPGLLNTPLSSFTEIEGINLSNIKEDTQLIKDIMQYHGTEVPAKFEKCLELINDITSRGEKVIVWACYINTINQLYDFLNANGVSSRKLYGATPVAADGMEEEDEGYELTRESIIKQFHSLNSPFKVIIANPFAVAESISLHKACHNAIYLERSFNAAHFMQSKDRIHRYGLPQGINTNYYYLISENSVDETIHRRLQEKEARMLEIIESMPIPLFDNVSEDGGIDDIKAILQDYAQRTNKI